MSRVLVVCDDRDARRQLGYALRWGHFSFKATRTADAVGGLLRRGAFDAVVVMDLADVDFDVAVCELRARTELPMLVVSEHADERDKVAALDAGADDYLTSPYGIEELLARLRATLRRFARADGQGPVVTDDFTVFVRDRRLVLADGSEPRLTSTEWKIIEVLLNHPDHLVSQADLLRSVWGPDAVDKSNYLRVHMVNIRRKVEPDPSRPRYFVTAPGLGLRFVPAAAEARESVS